MSPDATKAGASRASVHCKNLVHKNDVIIQWRVLPVKDARLAPEVVARGHISLFQTIAHFENNRDKCMASSTFYTDCSNHSPPHCSKHSMIFAVDCSNHSKLWTFYFMQDNMPNSLFCCLRGYITYLIICIVWWGVRRRQGGCGLETTQTGLTGSYEGTG